MQNSLPQDFEGFDTLYNMVKFQRLDGKTIADRYQVVEFLGAGGMGDVYRSYDQKNKKFVAMKRLIPPANTEQRFLLHERFECEVSALEAVISPYTVEIYEAFLLDSFYYIIMEFIEGQTLDKIITEYHGTSKALSVLETISLMAKIARGLEAIHAAGIVHRDIKPSNIMVNRLKDVVKILDLGLALQIENREQDDSLAGTYAYMSPEQINGQELSSKSDIFSLGSTFYFILTGKAPFSGSGIQSMIQICEKVPVAPHLINKVIPKLLSDAIMKAMEKDPDKRFQDAGEFADSLQKLHRRFMTHLTELFTTQPTFASSSTQRLSLDDFYFLHQIRLLKNPDKKKQMRAVKKLGYIRNEKAVKPLLSLLRQAHKNNDSTLVIQIITSLGKIGNIAVLDPVREMKKNMPKRKIIKACQSTINKLLGTYPSYRREIEKKTDSILLKWEQGGMSKMTEKLKLKYLRISQAKKNKKI